MIDNYLNIMNESLKKKNAGITYIFLSTIVTAKPVSGLFA